MYQIIATTLFQNKICRLPGIGTLRMVAHSAETDFVNARIKSPAYTIDFIAERNDENVFNEFSAMSEILQKSLNENGRYFLKGIGTFLKDGANIIDFTPIPINAVFTIPISAERVIRQDEAHAILVGDQQTTNVEMTEFFTEKETLDDKWWIWAIVFAAVGVSALLFYFYKYGLQALGNMAH